MKHFNLYLLLFVLSSCGTHFGRHQGIKLQRNNSTCISKDVAEKTSAVKSIQAEESVPKADLFASTSEDEAIFLAEPVTVEQTQTARAEPCDKILLRNGNEIQAKVLEVGLSTVKYKKCEDQEGPLIEVKKNDIFMITYSNGSKDVFKETVANEEKQNPPTTQVVPQALPQAKKHGFAVASLVFGLIGMPLFAWIFGGIAKSLIRKYPESYDGKGMANAGIILGWIAVILIIIIILL
jgi:hypothetical protein